MDCMTSRLHPRAWGPGYDLPKGKGTPLSVTGRAPRDLVGPAYVGKGGEGAVLLLPLDRPFIGIVTGRI